MFYKSVLGILRRDTNLYLTLTEVRNFLVSLQYFAVLYSAQFMKRFGIQATFGKSLKDAYHIVSRSLSSAILNFLGVRLISLMISTVQENYVML